MKKKKVRAANEFVLSMANYIDLGVIVPRKFFNKRNPCQSSDNKFKVVSKVVTNKLYLLLTHLQRFIKIID